MSFDYFYGPDDAEQYSFYRIPKRLITGEEFQDTSTEAKLLSELENKTGLIKRKRQRHGKPSLIYVLKFSTGCPQNDSESHFKTCENHTSGDVKTTSLDVWKSHENNTDLNKTENNKTNPIYEAHRSELELHEAAKRAFDALPEGTKLPTIKELNAERKKLIEERKSEYEQYRPLRDQKKDFLRAKQNADLILHRQQEERDEKTREK